MRSQEKLQFLAWKYLLPGRMKNWINGIKQHYISSGRRWCCQFYWHYRSVGETQRTFAISQRCCCVGWHGFPVKNLMNSPRLIRWLMILLLLIRGKIPAFYSLVWKGKIRLKSAKFLNSISQNYLQQNVERKSEEAGKSLAFLKSNCRLCVIHWMMLKIN